MVRSMLPAASSRGLPARQPIAILDQAQGLEVVLRRRLEGLIVAERVHEMRERAVVGTLIFGGEIVSALAGRCARAGQRWPVEPDGSVVAQYLQPVDLHGRMPMGGEACKDRNASAVARPKLDYRAVLADEEIAGTGKLRRHHLQRPEQHAQRIEMMDQDF